MSKLDDYANITERRKEFFQRCVRKVGPLSIGPTNRGGIFMKYDERELFNDISVHDLKLFRDLINDFLANVVGEQ